MIRKFPIPAWLAAVLGGFTYLLLHLVIELGFPEHWSGSPAHLLGASYAGWSRLLWLPIALLLLGLRRFYQHLAPDLGRLARYFAVTAHGYRSHSLNHSHPPSAWTTITSPFAALR